jgi:hypothetical protein
MYRPGHGSRFLAAVIVVSLVAVDSAGCNNPLFDVDRTPSYVPYHLKAKFADLALLEEPSERANKMCFSGESRLSCCSDASYQVLQAVYNKQKMLIVKAKSRLELMPNPASFLRLVVDLAMDEDNFETEAEAARTSKELESIQSGLVTLETRIDGLNVNTRRCMDSLLEFEAGMLCMACSAEYEEFITETDGEIQLKLSENTRAALLSGCCPLAMDMADAFTLASDMKLALQTANVTAGDVDLTFLKTLEFPTGQALRDACPAPIKECADRDTTCVATALNNATNATAAANQLISGMVNALEQPEMPGPSFSPESFTPNGLSVVTRKKKKKLRCKGVAGVGEKKAMRRWCNQNCNHIPKFCPTTHCDCRERRAKSSSGRLLLGPSNSSEFITGYITGLWGGAADESAYDVPTAVGSDNLFEPQPRVKPIDNSLIAAVCGGTMLLFLLVRIAYGFAVKNGWKSMLYHVCTCKWITLFKFSWQAIRTDADEIKKKMKKAASDLNSQWEQMAGKLEPLYMTDTGQPPDYDRIEASASTAGSYYHLWLNYAMTIDLHIKRAFLTDTLIHEVASLKEKKYLKHKMGMDEKMVTARNLLVWRRSMMVVMIVPNLVTSLFTQFAVYSKWNEYQNMKLSASEVILQENYISISDGMLDIPGYAAATSLVSIRGVYVDVLRVDFICQLALVILSWIAFGSNLMALVRWTKYHESRTWLIIGWFGMYLAPFLVSLVPKKEFLNWEKYNLDNQWVLSLYGNNTGVAGMAGMDYGKDYLLEQTHNVRIFVELSVGLFNGIKTFVTLVPACVALGPALIRAAKAIKILLPESSFPPVIQMVVPILFSPLVWSMYNIVLQLVGDSWLLIALIIISFSPLVNVYFVYRAGDDRNGLFRPMRGEEAVYTYRQFAKYTQVLSIGAFVFLGCWAYNSEIFHKLGDLLKTYAFDEVLVEVFDGLKKVGITKIVVKVLASYFYMTACGSDFIIDTIQTLRKWEIYLLAEHKRKDSTKEMLKQTTCGIGERPEGTNEGEGYIGIPPPCIVFSTETKVTIKEGEREGKTGTIVKARTKKHAPPLTETREGKKYKIRLDDPSGNKRNVLVLGEHLEVIDTSKPKRDLKELREAKLDQVVLICNSKVRHTKSLWDMFKIGAHQTIAIAKRKTVSGKIRLSMMLTGTPGALSLEVNVVRAIELTAKDAEWHCFRKSTFSSDPYAVVEVSGGAPKGETPEAVPCKLAPMVGGEYQNGMLNPRTKVVEHDLNPGWDAKFVFEPLLELNGAKLKVTLFDKDEDDKDDEMGLVVVSLDGLSIGSLHEQWYNVGASDQRNVVRKLTLGAYEENKEVDSRSESNAAGMKAVAMAVQVAKNPLTTGTPSVEMTQTTSAGSADV